MQDNSTKYGCTTDACAIAINKPVRRTNQLKKRNNIEAHTQAKLTIQCLLHVECRYYTLGTVEV